MERKKKVCLITPNHIASNPRLIKEASALEQAGYMVEIIFTQNLGYLSKEDNLILAEYPQWEYSSLDWTGNGIKSTLIRLISGGLHKLLRYLSYSIDSVFVSTLLYNRHYFWQRRKAIKAKANLYIAHNLGALPVACSAARRHQTSVVFDAEDFHRHELSDDLSNRDVLQKKAIEDKFFPLLSHATTASPLIANAYRKHYPSVEMITIRNVFPLVAPNDVRCQAKGIRLFWFSQTVGLNRGLQDVIKALKIVEHLPIELHVYGYLPSENQRYFQALLEELRFVEIPPVFFHDPVSPDNILNLATTFDVGLAIEPGFSMNNKIALSNKIFTYLLGGNAIIFSRTPAQEDFFTNYPGIGYIYDSGDFQQLAKIFMNYFENPVLLRQHQERSKQLYISELNWDKEKQYFLTSVAKGIN